MKQTLIQTERVRFICWAGRIEIGECPCCLRHCYEGAMELGWSGIYIRRYFVTERDHIMVFRSSLFINLSQDSHCPQCLPRYMLPSHQLCANRQENIREHLPVPRPVVKIQQRKCTILLKPCKYQNQINPICTLQEIHLPVICSYF